MLDIEKGIPLPDKNTQYPFNAMEVGDSFLVKCAVNEMPRVKNSLFSAIRKFSIKHKSKSKFASRRVDGGIRVWRTE